MTACSALPASYTHHRPATLAHAHPHPAIVHSYGCDVVRRRHPLFAESVQRRQERCSDSFTFQLSRNCLEREERRARDLTFSHRIDNQQCAKQTRRPALLALLPLQGSLHLYLPRPRALSLALSPLSRCGGSWQAAISHRGLPRLQQ